VTPSPSIPQTIAVYRLTYRGWIDLHVVCAAIRPCRLHRCSLYPNVAIDVEVRSLLGCGQCGGGPLPALGGDGIRG
jgi:hypothetical protein